MSGGSDKPRELTDPDERRKVVRALAKFLVEEIQERRRVDRMRELDGKRRRR